MINKFYQLLNISLFYYSIEYTFIFLSLKLDPFFRFSIVYKIFLEIIEENFMPLKLIYNISTA